MKANRYSYEISTNCLVSCLLMSTNIVFSCLSCTHLRSKKLLPRSFSLEEEREKLMLFFLSRPHALERRIVSLLQHFVDRVLGPYSIMTQLPADFQQIFLLRRRRVKLFLFRWVANWCPVYGIVYHLPLELGVSGMHGNVLYDSCLLLRRVSENFSADAPRRRRIMRLLFRVDAIVGDEATKWCSVLSVSFSL